ncbi:uncharacterized protein SAZU_0930 [Streptomyces azureus]|uniref:Uncharacterized protein n=1 Tax=Streptomyces azureus TaxID=146537 RepID=A0A0K8PEA2_STRAJ|nr:uncharacterized protein SAZU_0930 [Streptomyces azureus]
MLALDTAATLRPLRRTVSALRMREHPLREDLRRAHSPHELGCSRPAIEGIANNPVNVRGHSTSHVL